MNFVSGGPKSAVLALRAVPRGGIVRDAALALGGSLLIALSAQIAIPLWFTPVPLTGQTFAVLLVGAALGSRRGAAALALYLLEGGIGLPFFAMGASGWPAGPSGGYLLGFVAAAYVVGLLAERGWDRRFVTAAVAMLAGEAAIYAVGLPWLGFYVGPEKAVPLGLLPFIPGDAVKLALAALALPSTWKVVGKGKAH